MVARVGQSGRLAGVFYLLTIACGLFAQVRVRGSVVVADDPAATARSIVNSETLVRAGMVVDLTMLASYLAVTVLLFHLLARSGRLLALAALSFSVVGISVLGATSVLHMAALILADTQELDVGVATGSLAPLALQLHGVGYNVSLWFFAFYCVLIGWLAARRPALPRVVCILMIAGGVARLVMTAGWFLDPETVRALPSAVRMVPLLGEGAFALWLTAFGVKDERLHGSG